MTFIDKKIIVGVTGGIASYKSISLCSALVKLGAKVQPILTRGSLNFVTKDTFRAITGVNPLVEVWEEPFSGKIAHIYLADESDLIIIAPSTAHFLAKHANGFADDMLSNILIATKDTSKVCFFPSMNVNMYNHPAVKKNIETIKSFGSHICDPKVGYLACGYEDEGRLPNTKEMIEFVSEIIK